MGGIPCTEAAETPKARASIKNPGRRQRTLAGLIAWFNRGPTVADAGGRQQLGLQVREGSHASRVLSIAHGEMFRRCRKIGRCFAAGRPRSLSDSDVDPALKGMKWSGAPTSGQVSDRVEEYFRIRIPKDLRQVLLRHGGGEGQIGPRVTLRLWPIEDWVRINTILEATLNYPGLVLFGEDAGGGFFGLDNGGVRFVRVEGIGDSEPEALGSSFGEFLARLAVAAG